MGLPCRWTPFAARERPVHRAGMPAPENAVCSTWPPAAFLCMVLRCCMRHWEAFQVPRYVLLPHPQAAKPHVMPAPAVDFSNRHAAWSLGQGVRVGLSDLTLLGLCAMVMAPQQPNSAPSNTPSHSHSHLLNGAAPPAPAPGQSSVLTALPDHLLVTAGFSPQGRVLALAAPLWAMHSMSNMGHEAHITLGPPGSSNRLYTAVPQDVHEGAKGRPPGQALVSRCTLAVPASELLLYHYLLLWADAAPSLIDRQNRSTTAAGYVTVALASSGQQLPPHSMDALSQLASAVLPARAWAGSSPTFRAYSPAPGVVHIAQWSPMPSNSSMQVGLKVGLPSMVEMGVGKGVAGGTGRAMVDPMAAWGRGQCASIVELGEGKDQASGTCDLLLVSMVLHAHLHYAPLLCAMPTCAGLLPHSAPAFIAWLRQRPSPLASASIRVRWLEL